jgi:hypothetical protein
MKCYPTLQPAAKHAIFDRRIFDLRQKQCDEQALCPAWRNVRREGAQDDCD